MNRWAALYSGKEVMTTICYRSRVRGKVKACRVITVSFN